MCKTAQGLNALSGFTFYLTIVKNITYKEYIWNNFGVVFLSISIDK